MEHKIEKYHIREVESESGVYKAEHIKVGNTYISKKIFSSDGMTYHLLKVTGPYYLMLGRNITNAEAKELAKKYLETPENFTII